MTSGAETFIVRHARPRPRMRVDRSGNASYSCTMPPTWVADIGATAGR